MQESVDESNINPELTRYRELLLESVTNGLHGKTAEVALPIIDQHISTVEEILRTLKTSRNTWSLTTQLPAEVLCQIFHHVRDADWRRLMSDTPEWISITHVCQHWRKVAINDPTLWSKLPVRHEKWTNEMLRRSCTANLFVHTEVYARRALPHLFSTIKSILSHSDRLEELVLLGFAREALAHKMLDGCLPSSTPCLRVIKLRSALYRRRRHISIPEDSFNHSPHLRHLELEGCDFSWTSNFLRGLTYLSIDSPLKKPSLEELLGVLKQMPALETLFLENVLPTTTLNGLHNPQEIKLNYLRDLQVTGECSLSNAMDLLRSLIFPAACKLNFGAWSITPAMLVDFSALLSRISACYFDRTISIPSLALSTNSVSGGWSIGFEASRTTPLHDFSCDTLSHISLTLYESGSGPIDIEESVIAAFMSLPYQNLTYLKIDGRKIGDHLSKTFASLSYLKSMCVSTKNAVNLLLAMMETPADEGGISFPALSSISFNGVVFASEDNSPDYIVQLQQLQQCLVRRVEQNAPILSLELTGCYHIKEEDVDQLRRLVPDVQWDEQSRPWDSVHHTDLTVELLDDSSSSYLSSPTDRDSDE